MLKNGYGQYLLQAAAREGVLMKVTADRVARCADPRAHGLRRRARLLLRELQPARVRRRPGRLGLPTCDASCRTTTRARKRRRAARPALPAAAACPGQAGARGAGRGVRRRRRHPRAARRPSAAGWAWSSSAANRRQLWIPAGFAHGFVALTDDTHFLYKTTDVYARDCERSILWNDPAIGVTWPRVTGHAPLIAPKDAAAPLLAQAELPPL